MNIVLIQGTFLEEILSRPYRRLKVVCFFHCISSIYFYACCISCLASPSLNFISDLTPQLPGCLHSSLAKVPFSRKKKNRFNLNFTGFEPKPDLTCDITPYLLCSILLRDKHWQPSPVEPLNIFRLTFTSAGEECKSSVTDFTQMLFDMSVSKRIFAI